MIVLGADAIGFIYDSSWKPIVCVRSISMTINTDYIKTSVSGAGKNETVVPTENNCTATMEGVVSLNEPGTLSLADLQAMQEAHTKFLFRFQRTDQSGHVYTSEAYFFIVSSTDTGSFDGLDTFSLEMRRSGGITQIFTPTPNPLNSNKVKRYEYTGAGSELDFTSPLLIGKDILEIVKDGMGRASIITSGAPVNLEAKYTSSTGKIEFPQIFQAGEKCYVLYQDI